MKRGYLKAAIFWLLTITCVFLNMTTARAASANIEISAGNNTVTVGDTVHVYINIKSDKLFSDVEANLVYDEDILEYKSGPSFITGSSGFLRISDVNISEESKSRKYSLEFKALKVGKCEIEFTGSVMVYDYESGFPMSVSSNVLELEVKAEQTASENVNLSSLKISPGELTPAFDKNVYEYSTNVGYDVEKLVVVAIPEDEKATISISGNDMLKAGENKVTVTVTGEAGNKKEYTINVTKESAPDDGLDTGEITPDDKHGSFELVRGEDNQIYAVYSGKYKIIVPDDSVKIPEGFTRTKIIISGISIDAFAPEDETDSDFVLIYAENELGEANFYRYDKVERTMQRYVDEQSSSNQPEENPDVDAMNAEKYRSKLNKAAIVIAILSAVCILLMVLCIRMFIKSSEGKYKKRK